MCIRDRLGIPIHRVISPVNLVMLYLAAVVIAAIYLGRGPAILASVLGVLTFDFFLIEPRLTLTVADTEYIFTFIGLFVVGLVMHAFGWTPFDILYGIRTFFERIWNMGFAAFEHFVGYIVLGAAIGFCLAFIVVADVIGRVGFNSPLKGTPEIVSSAIVVICWLQAAYAIRSGGMINVDAFTIHMPVRWQALLAAFGALLRVVLEAFGPIGDTWSPYISAVAVATMLVGAMVSTVQNDLKRFLAYSSIAHLGFVMLGLFAIDLLAWQGALLQMVNHGLSTGALFLLVGMLYDRRHTKKFADFGGLARPMPWFAFFLSFAALASVGLPGLNGFVGEFLILVGTYRSGLHWAAIVGAIGVILAAVYLLRMLHETIYGPVRHDENRNLADLSLREVFRAALDVTGQPRLRDGPILLEVHALVAPIGAVGTGADHVVVDDVEAGTIRDQQRVQAPIALTIDLCIRDLDRIGADVDRLAVLAQPFQLPRARFSAALPRVSISGCIDCKRQLHEKGLHPPDHPRAAGQLSQTRSLVASNPRSWQAVMQC